jgi:hypothetical protein
VLEILAMDGDLTSSDSVTVVVIEDDLSTPEQGSSEGSGTGGGEIELGSDVIYAAALDGTPYSADAVPRGNVDFIALLPGIDRQWQLDWSVTDPHDSSFLVKPAVERSANSVRSACPGGVTVSCSLARFRLNDHGQRLVTLSVTDPAGKTEVITASVIIVAPLAVEVYGPSSVLAEDTVTFVGRIIGGVGEPEFNWNINFEDAVPVVSGLGPCISVPDIGLESFVVEPGLPCAQGTVTYIFDEAGSRWINFDVTSGAEAKSTSKSFTISPFWGVIEVEVVRYSVAVCGSGAETYQVTRSHFSLFREGEMEELRGRLAASLEFYAPTEWGGVCFDRGKILSSSGGFAVEDVSPDEARAWIEELRDASLADGTGSYAGNGSWVVRHPDDGEKVEVPRAEICADSPVTCGL